MKGKTKTDYYRLKASEKIIKARGNSTFDIANDAGCSLPTLLKIEKMDTSVSMTMIHQVIDNL